MRAATVSLVAATALALAACGSGEDEGSGNGSEGTTTLQVAAAASLAEAFEELAQDFESENHGVEVELQLAGSSDLASQIENGADIDVFASADEPNMDTVSDLVQGEPEIFATNVLTIITEPGNPKKISGLEDLAADGTTVVVCAEQVPCGAATAKLAKQEKVTLSPASEESKVTDVLAKVRSGEADAGLVYTTDATSAGEDVERVETEGAEKVVNRYPIAALSDASSPEEAEAFVDLVTGDEGQKVLEEKGFGTP